MFLNHIQYNWLLGFGRHFSKAFYLDNVELTDIKSLEKQIYEKVKSSNPEIVENINNTGKLDEETEKKLSSLIEEFKKNRKDK